MAKRFFFCFYFFYCISSSSYSKDDLSFWQFWKIINVARILERYIERVGRVCCAHIFLVVRGVAVADGQRLLTIKTPSSTRWHNCHAASVRALSINYEQYFNLVRDLADDDTQNAETCFKAQSLAEKLATLEFAFMRELWDRILKESHRTSLRLQSPDLYLKAACALVETLQDFIEKLPDEFEDVEG